MTQFVTKRPKLTTLSHTARDRKSQHTSLSRHRSSHMQAEYCAPLSRSAPLLQPTTSSPAMLLSSSSQGPAFDPRFARFFMLSGYVLTHARISKRRSSTERHVASREPIVAFVAKSTSIIYPLYALGLLLSLLLTPPIKQVFIEYNLSLTFIGHPIESPPYHPISPPYLPIS